MVEYKIDKTDRRILQMLEENARISVKDIAEANFMSSPAVANRIRRMEANNLIKHYYADIDYPSMGYVVKAFINLEVKPEDKSEFYPFIEKIPNVIQCDCVTGDYSMLIQAAYQRPEELDRRADRQGGIFTRPLRHQHGQGHWPPISGPVVARGQGTGGTTAA